MDTKDARLEIRLPRRTKELMARMAAERKVTTSRLVRGLFLKWVKDLKGQSERSH